MDSIGQMMPEKKKPGIRKAEEKIRLRTRRSQWLKLTGREQKCHFGLRTDHCNEETIEMPEKALEKDQCEERQERALRGQSEKPENDRKEKAKLCDTQHSHTEAVS